MRDIQQVLERWGAWAANEGGSVYYQPVAAGFKGVIPFSRRTRESCSDNDGLIVSSAVGVLKKKDPYLYTLLEWYYVHSVPVRTIGSRLGVSHTLVLKRLQTAEGFVDGCLAALGVTLEMDRYVQREHVGVKVSAGASPERLAR
ncbi:antitermination protein [Salmonella enterica subsp. enterica serovar Oranienburg]|nr:antitermination protein [Salmonella enterica subsp. enterica serovar Oranienburg]HAK8205184.1 antitermination protein [Salmonella enterica]